MVARFLLIAWLVTFSAASALAQTSGAAAANQGVPLRTASRAPADSASPDAADLAPPLRSSSDTDTKWKTPNINDTPSRNAPAGIGRGGLIDDGVAPLDGDPARPINLTPRRSISRVTSGEPVLPHSQGQVWREYDISPYTLRVSSTNRPEQAIVDWILRETGYETWHSEPFGFLSADRRSLRVYHTPEMHAVVNEAVDRFVNSEAESQAFGLRVVTIGHPNWRAKTVNILRPLPVQTQGIQAWLVHKEDAAAMLAELRRRNDFREHSSPHLLVQNGQSSTVAAMQPRTYTRDVTMRPDAWPSYTPEIGQFEEGFSLELNPLFVAGWPDDRRRHQMQHRPTREARARHAGSPRHRGEPAACADRSAAGDSLSSARTFPLACDQVLIVGLGVVATPLPVEPNPLLRVLPIASSPQRADLLVFVESKGKATPPAASIAPATARSAQRDARIYRGRY